MPLESPENHPDTEALKIDLFGLKELITEDNSLLLGLSELSEKEIENWLRPENLKEETRRTMVGVGQILHIPRGMPHGFLVEEKNFEFLSIQSPPIKQKDGAEDFLSHSI